MWPAKTTLENDNGTQKPKHLGGYMKTNVRVIVELEVEHEERMPLGKVEEIARNDLHHAKTAGGSVDYGHYRVKEIWRTTEI
jgi:hypothetical protein